MISKKIEKQILEIFKQLDLDSFLIIGYRDGELASYTDIEQISERILLLESYRHFQLMSIIPKEN